MDKIEDFGVHANAYYPVKVEMYKTKLDEKLLELLWNKYWVATLSQSLIVSVRPVPSYQLELISVEPAIRDITSHRLDSQAEIGGAVPRLLDKRPQAQGCPVW